MWSDLVAARMILQAAPAVRVYCLGEKTTRNAFRLSPSRLRDDFRVLPFGSRCCRCDVAVLLCWRGITREKGMGMGLGRFCYCMGCWKWAGMVGINFGLGNGWAAGKVEGKGESWADFCWN
ncbi:hypothetical protein KY290_018030 [Solanum tuberosum]|uniref:Uncharacterized protein n=1 Tax=Solanum tuberosum TaxID=4113 RepID=A0ABQ7VD01_SOLTU|nr:hypothetical protein KY285_016995 [Solanum tuberosum]KAH0761957.1 hypothetical protein KY290_018030 [Solanum tuberosum]